MSYLEVGAKQPRNKCISFIGKKYSQKTCPSCKTKYERMAFDKAVDKCPRCVNKHLEDENGIL